MNQNGLRPATRIMHKSYRCSTLNKGRKSGRSNELVHPDRKEVQSKYTCKFLYCYRLYSLQIYNVGSSARTAQQSVCSSLHDLQVWTSCVEDRIQLDNYRRILQHITPDDPFAHPQEILPPVFQLPLIVQEQTVIWLLNRRVLEED